MYDLRILLNKLGVALAVCGVMLALIRWGPHEIKEGVATSLLVVLSAVGTAVANDLQTYKASKRAKRE